MGPRVDEKTGRLIRPTIYELEEKNKLLEEALWRSELEFMAQKMRLDALIEFLRQRPELSDMYIIDTFTSRSTVESQGFPLKDAVDLFNPDNIR